MDEPMYRVCPDRNVPAAFQPFLGADSGGIDRFFDSAVERELFGGRRWHYGMASFASNCREATQELLALRLQPRFSSFIVERAEAAVAVCAALRPLAIALWIKMKSPALGGAGARFNGRRLVSASCIRGVAAASLQ